MEPTAKAKFVEMTTLHDTAASRCSDRRAAVAVHRRAAPRRSTKPFDASGRRTLWGGARQNGAPIRLVVPWKCGFKGVKSIVRIRFVENQPRNTWQIMAPRYGFYANVNPTVDHPRWSQARERRLPSFIPNHKTEMFNGYTEQVAHLHKDMDLRKNY